MSWFAQVTKSLSTEVCQPLFLLVLPSLCRAREEDQERLTHPRRQLRQTPQCPPCHPDPTRSPTFHLFSPSAISKTSPTISWPGQRGNTLDMCPSLVTLSLWQIPHARTYGIVSVLYYERYGRRWRQGGGRTGGGGLTLITTSPRTGVLYGTWTSEKSDPALVT